MKQTGAARAVGVVVCLGATMAWSAGCESENHLFTGSGGAGGAGGTGGTTSNTGGDTASTGGNSGGGGSGASGGGTTTTNGPCTPGEKVACYEGPSGTKGVGQCTEGTAECDADGMGFGPCAGQVLPAVENCAKAGDEDCDGKGPACTGEAEWAKRFGGAKDESGPLRVALDPSENVFLTAALVDVTDFGGGALTPTSVDAFVVKLNSKGEHLWSKKLGGSQFDAGEAIVTDSSGNVIVAGSFWGSADFGGGVLQNAGLSDVFLLALDPDGNHLWSQRFGDADIQTAHSITRTADGDILLCGAFGGAIDLGGGAITSAGKQDVFVTRLDSSGGHVWTRQLSNTENVSCRGLQVDPQGNVLVAGSMDSDLSAGGAVLPVVGGALVNNAFVVKLSGAGAHLWSKSYGDPTNQTARGLAVDQAGNVYLTGSNAGTVNFGGDALLSAGGSDVFVAKLSPAGEHLWSKLLGDAADQAGNEIAVDPAGNVVVVGTFSGSIDLGGGALVSQGSGDVFVAKLDPEGNPLWSKATSGANGESADTLALSPAGAVVFAGEFGGTLNLAGDALVSSGPEDFFVARLAP